ncbi:hypothetical protein D6D13_07550 [Aureobasidium pullulans]|uniref:Uncharacterized protein n=1 Tax=Aureobasidium pullulans TaxID=5580 RepID=A0A4S9CD77_AURPU|nr:hypothetical protein D6D13_07550 [Aureobasidium pullulans]
MPAPVICAQGRKRSRDNATTIGLFPSRHGKGPYGPGSHYREGTHHQPFGGGSWRLGLSVSTRSSAKSASGVARLYDGFESQDFIWRKSPPGCHRQQYEGARHQRRDARHSQQYLPRRGRLKSPSRLQHLQQPRHLGYIDRHHVHDSVCSGVKQGDARHRQQYHLGRGGGGYYQQGRILGPYDNDDGTHHQPFGGGSRRSRRSASTRSSAWSASCAARSATVATANISSPVEPTTSSVPFSWAMRKSRT